MKTAIAGPRAPRRRMAVAGLLATLSIAAHADGATSRAGTQARIDEDLAAGRPIVVHVVVALCDNVHQGIVPVPAHLGNGQDPGSNLYWGALYGVRTHLVRARGWEKVWVGRPSVDGVLERVVLARRLRRAGGSVVIHLVADAWDGAKIRGAVSRFLDMASGGVPESVAAGPVILNAGGAAHLVAYVGHNGLMDFDVPTLRSRAQAPARDAVILACASKPYFLDRLQRIGAHPLLLTTGLMAPEAYTLDAALEPWLAGESGTAVRDGAARAYDRFQRCGLAAARRLFWSGDSGVPQVSEP